MFVWFYCLQCGWNLQVQEGCQFVVDIGGYVQVDGIDQFDWVYWYVEFYCGFVDYWVWDVFGVGGGGFQYVWEQYVVDQEIWVVGYWYWEFVQCFVECGQVVFGFWCYVIVVDDFYQWYLCYWIEVVQVGELCWVLDVIVQFYQWD